MALTIINGPIIQAGQSISDPLDCSAGDLVRITMPGNWSTLGAPSGAPPVLTFQISTDGILYNDLYRADGREVEVTVVPGAAVMVDLMYRKFNWIKFRSGTKEWPVTQPELREFAVVVEAGP